MKARLITGLCLILGLALGLLYYGHWIGPGARLIRTVQRADFSLRLPGRGEVGMQPVSLPHKWPNKRLDDGTVALYRVALPPEAAQADWAVSVADRMPETRVFIGGSQRHLTHLTGHMGEPLLAPLGEVGANPTLVFSVAPHFGLRGGLGEIRVGPRELLEPQAKVMSILREVSHLWIIGTALAVAIFSWGAYGFRGDPLLLALGVAASGISLHHALPFIGGYWDNDGLELAVYATSSTLVAAGLFFLMELATRQRKSAVTYLVLTGLVVAAWIQLGQLFEFETRRAINVSFILIVPILACARSGPRILAQRQWLLLLTLVFFVVRALLAARSLIANHGFYGFDDVEHQIRLTPLGILAAMLLGARHIYMAMKNYEMANISLSREIQNYKAELAAASEREKALAIEQAASAERLHWMQEIHDGLGSHLIAARFLADKTAETPGGLEAVKQSIDDSIEDLRELVESLSPDQATVPSLLGALRYRLAPRYERAGLTLLWSVDPMIEAGELTAAQAINVQRIAQEALTNILKHADARTVRMQIFTRRPSIVLRIEDDGKGFDTAQPRPGRGISNMRKRARDCQGELIVSALNPGTRIELTLPNDPGP